MHSLSEFDFYLTEFGSEPFLYSPSEHSISPIAALPSADMYKSEEVERFGFSEAPSLSIFNRKAAKLDETSFLGTEFQVELPKSLSEFDKKAPCFPLVLESNNEIVSPSHGDYLSVSLGLTRSRKGDVRGVSGAAFLGFVSTAVT